MKLVNSIFKEDRFAKELKQTGLLADTLQKCYLVPSLKYYERMVQQNREQDFIKYLLKVMEEKNHIYRKIKVLILWTEIFKVTKYDLSDILLNKKLKIFTKTAPFKQPFRPTIDQSNVEDYCLVNILVPLYNYFMKLSVNEDLFRHCVIGKVPENDAFRRGTKIRYIWVFKIYNLINVIVSLLHPCCSVLKKFPNFRGLFQITKILYKDALIMNNFVIEAIQQGCQDNYLLMPYFDMLQFYESLTQQKEVGEQMNEIYLSLKGIVIERTFTEQSIYTNQESLQNNEILKQNTREKQEQEIKQPRTMQISEQLLEQIQTQAMKVQLLNCSLKNPKKKYTQLQTEYYQKLNTQQNKYMKTQINAPSKKFNYGQELEEEFIEKYRNLD